MSVERNRFGFDGEISFECDHCGAEFHSESAGFDTALALLKAEGWRVYKRRGSWEHECPSCRDDLEDFE